MARLFTNLFSLSEAFVPRACRILSLRSKNTAAVKFNSFLSLEIESTLAKKLKARRASVSAGKLNDTHRRRKNCASTITVWDVSGGMGVSFKIKIIHPMFSDMTRRERSDMVYNMISHLVDRNQVSMLCEALYMFDENGFSSEQGKTFQH